MIFIENKDYDENFVFKILYNLTEKGKKMLKNTIEIEYNNGIKYYEINYKKQGIFKKEILNIKTDISSSYSDESMYEETPNEITKTPSENAKTPNEITKTPSENAKTPNKIKETPDRIKEFLGKLNENIIENKKIKAKDESDLNKLLSDENLIKGKNNLALINLNFLKEEATLKISKENEKILIDLGLDTDDIEKINSKLQKKFIKKNKNHYKYRKRLSSNETLKIIFKKVEKKDKIDVKIEDCYIEPNF